MKHLKLFENNGEQKLEKVLREYNEMCDLLKEFLILENYVEKDNIRDVYMFYFAKDLEILGDRGLVIAATDKDRKEEAGAIIFEKDFKNLFRFIEDPDLYKQTKKYNI